MPNTTYTTRQIARAMGIHVNTVRFYESAGLLTRPLRRPNGYRAYTDLHLFECRLIRAAMKAEVLQNGLRKQAVAIVRLCAQRNMDMALCAAREYQSMIAAELSRARQAARYAEEILSMSPVRENRRFTRTEAAAEINVTRETLRTWERSGLLREARFENRQRIFNGEDMRHLRVIRALRCANYSLSAILRLFSKTDGRADGSVEAILNTPDANEEIVSACDKLILSLEGTARDARQIEIMLKDAAEKFQPYSNTPPAQPPV